MDREEAREAAEVMLHFADGGEVQMGMPDDWWDVSDPVFNWACSKYRKKPEPREFWVRVDGGGRPVAVSRVIKKRYSDEWIKVREVADN